MRSEIKDFFQDRHLTILFRTRRKSFSIYLKLFQIWDFIEYFFYFMNRSVKIWKQSHSIQKKLKLTENIANLIDDKQIRVRSLCLSLRILLILDFLRGTVKSRLKVKASIRFFMNRICFQNCHQTQSQLMRWWWSI